MLVALLLWGATPVASSVSSAERIFQQAESARAAKAERFHVRTLYEKAARQGHLGAQATLGLLMFQEGKRESALRWLRTAADAGEPRAMLIYGTALFNGDGVTPDRKRGFALVSQAAKLGVAEAETTRSEMELVLTPAEKPQPTVEIAAAETASFKASASKRRGKAGKAAVKVQTKSAPAAKAGATNAATSGDWRIQLGAFREAGAAQSLFARLGPKLPAKSAQYVPLGSLTRLLAGPYASQSEASAACRKLGAGQACFPTRLR